ncbi:MAG: hypothetical protein CTY16_02135 [Methylobacter sp.]|nr:MAG: hypothetical protein CTY16_02135 [Methylobacter sp.]
MGQLPSTKNAKRQQMLHPVHQKHEKHKNSLWHNPFYCPFPHIFDRTPQKTIAYFPYLFFVLFVAFVDKRKRDR